MAAVEPGIYMPLGLKNNKERWTYADYLTWPDDERWEIMDGVAYDMSPAPNTRHQSISLQLSLQIGSFLAGKQCKAFVAPFDVRFSEQLNASDNYVDTVVQPDILVVCDKSKLDERGCNGAPDFIIEISSPSTGKNDLTVKYDLYQHHGVKEYWIIHPEEQTVMVFKIDGDGLYGKPERYGGDDKVSVPLLGDLVIDLKDIFAQ
jgi:Uma2 family endonuclease